MARYENSEVKVGVIVALLVEFRDVLAWTSF